MVICVQYLSKKFYTCLGSRPTNHEQSSWYTNHQQPRWAYSRAYIRLMYEKTKGQFPWDLYWVNKTYKLQRSIPFHNLLHHPFPSPLLFHSILFLTISSSPIPSDPCLSHPVYLILFHLIPMYPNPRYNLLHPILSLSSLLSSSSSSSPSSSSSSPSSLFSSS